NGIGCHPAARLRHSSSSLVPPETVYSFEVRPQPSLGFGHAHPPARGVVVELVAPDSGDAEIVRLRMPEVKARHLGSWVQRPLFPGADEPRPGGVARSTCPVAPPRRD